MRNKHDGKVETFTQKTVSWNLSIVTDRVRMPRGASAFNHSFKALYMNEMFAGASFVNQDIGS
jgi:hypothetical protein